MSEQGGGPRRGSGEKLDERTVQRAYRRWAPVYDITFGAVAAQARHAAIGAVNARSPGRVLEVGVGTGLSLPRYRRDMRIVGIDLSPDMLAKARARVAAEALPHVEGLHEMDASALAFEDRSFDAVVAMFVMTVVPDPAAVMAELARVARPGGEVLLVNHFSRERGLRARIERGMARYATTFGWHPVFPLASVLTEASLTLVEHRDLPPAGLFSLVRFRAA